MFQIKNCYFYHNTLFNLHLLLKLSFVFPETKNLVNDVSLLIKEKLFVNYTSQNPLTTHWLHYKVKRLKWNLLNIKNSRVLFQLKLFGTKSHYVGLLKISTFKIN